MNRRDFIRSLNILIGGTLFLSNNFLSCSSTTVKRNIKNWLWLKPLNNFSSDDYKEYFKKIKQAGIHAIIPIAYNSRVALYRSKHLPYSNEWLEQILPLAKSAGLEVHAWIWSMICDIEEINEKHSDWFAINGNGQSSLTHPAYVGYYKFMCPNHPEVQEFIEKTVTELAGIDGLDGVHLDYIRYPDVILAETLQTKYNIVQDREYPEYDYCYCDRCVSLFQKQSGLDIRIEADPSQNKEWLRFRYNSLTNFINNRLIPAAHNKDKIITAAVFPNWQHVRQNWSEWKLDAVMPMLYHNFYNKGIDWIKEKTSEGVKNLKPQTQLFSGLYILVLNPEDFISAMDVSLKGGAAGISIFSAENMTEKHWEVFSKFVKITDR